MCININITDENRGNITRKQHVWHLSILCHNAEVCLVACVYHIILLSGILYKTRIATNTKNTRTLGIYSDQKKKKGTTFLIKWRTNNSDWCSKKTIVYIEANKTRPNWPMWTCETSGDKVMSVRYLKVRFRAE